MAEQLGDLTRTHTCGALRADDVGADVVLLGWVHRVRDLGGLLFIDVRDRAGITQVVFDKDDEALMAQGQAPALGVRRRRRAAACGAARPRRSTRSSPTGEVEVVVRAADDAQRGEDAAVSDRRRDAGVRGRAPQVPLPRSAAAAAAEQHRPAAPGDVGDPALLRRERLPRDRDADPHASRRPKGRATTWCRAACTRASSSRCRSRRSSSSRS